MPKVSVIIPVYNVEPYLRECLDSVVNQTLKDIEIICVNDGSTDGSLAILKEYAEKDKRIKVFSQKNKGQSAARNVGLEVADGDYIYFMDSDDLIELDCLELLYTKSSENDLDILYFDADVFFESKELEKRHENYSNYYDRKHTYKKIYSGENLFSDMLQCGDYKPSPCLQILKNNFLKENDINFFEGIIHEDNLFTFQSIMLAERVSHIERKLFHRRVRQNSTMTKNETSRNVIGYFICFIEMLKFGIRNNLKNDVVKGYVMSIFCSAQNKYNNLAEEERKKIKWDKNTFEYFMFQYLIKNPAPQKINLNKNVEYTLEEYKALQTQLNTVCNSKSYKLGRVLTYIPRKIRSGIRCYQEHGLRYTLRRLKEKLMVMHPLKRKSTNTIMLKEDKNIAVSVIVPVYNVEKYLEQCLESLLAQTLKNFEIICVNDGSTDSCFNILENYQKRDSRIKVIHQFNQYLGFARNTGLKAASGEYVVFIDSDDFVEIDLLEKIYYKAKITDADIVVFGADIYNQSLDQFVAAPWLLQNYKVPQKDSFSLEQIRKNIFNFTAPNVWTKLFKKSFLNKNNLYFVPFPSVEDIPFTYYAMALADKIAVENSVLVHYRKGITTNISSNKDDKALIFYDSYSLLQSELITAGVYEKAKQSFVNRCLSGCIYEIDSLRTEKAKRLVKQYFADEIIFKLDLYNTQKEYFYNYENYTKMQLLLKDAERWQEPDERIKVSVIVPVYNAEGYLVECLTSLNNQTLQEIEIICIDDGSTDNSLDILYEFEQVNPKIHVLEQQNSYAGVARNYGMRMSHGEYLIFLDADDFFEPNLLEKLYFSCKDNGAEVAVCAANSFHDKLTVYASMPWQLDEKLLNGKNVLTPTELKEQVFLFCTGVPWNKMFKREYIRNQHIYFQNTRCANDLYFSMLAIVNATKIAIVDEILVHYRIGMNSNLQSSNDKNPFDFCRALLGIRADLIRTNKYDAYKQSFSNLALNNCMYNLEKIRNDENAYKHLYKKLKEFYFPLFEIDSHDETYFFNKQYWNDYRKIMRR